MNNNTGQRLRQLRELVGICQAQVAAHIGCNRSIYSLAESGHQQLSAEDAAKAESYLQEEVSKKARELAAMVESFSGRELATA